MTIFAFPIMTTINTTTNLKDLESLFPVVTFSPEVNKGLVELQLSSLDKTLGTGKEDKNYHVGVRLSNYENINKQKVYEFADEVRKYVVKESKNIKKITMYVPKNYIKEVNELFQ